MGEARNRGASYYLVFIDRVSASFFGNELFESRQGAGGLENARYWQQSFRPSKVAYFVHANHELVPSHLEWSPLGKL